MNVATMEMPVEQAREKLKAYRSSLHTQADAEYQACLAGYRAMAKGLPLINLTDAIRAGGFDELMRPRLAIAIADRPEVKFEWNSGTWATFSTAKGTVWSGSPLLHRIDMGREHGRKGNHGWTIFIEAFAMVPMVPPEHRPAAD